MSQRVLITGAGGQLGRAIAARLTGRWEVGAYRRADLDIADREALIAACRSLRPHWVINCAAWTDVDRAESDPGGAHRINDAAVGALIEAAGSCGARVLHFSTDYVFDGRKRLPYIEEDSTAPLNAYGASKLAGERRLIESGAPAAILRTSWLYSEVGRNFLLTMLKLGADAAREGRPLRVVDDQVGSPTDVHTLAGQVEAVLEEDLRGLHHASGQGEASWYEFARAIFDLAGIKASIEPISTAEFPRPARRPAYSVLANRRLGAIGLDRMLPWREGLRHILERHLTKP